MRRKLSVTEIIGILFLIGIVVIVMIPHDDPKVSPPEPAAEVRSAVATTTPAPTPAPSTPLPAATTRFTTELHWQPAPQSGEPVGDKPADTEPPRKFLKISATDLYLGYEENEVAMHEQVRGAIVIVSGTLDGIREDFVDDVHLSLATSNPFASVDLALSQPDRTFVARLSKGQHVIVRCQTMERILNRPIGGLCTLLYPNRSGISEGPLAQ